MGNEGQVERGGSRRKELAGKHTQAKSVNLKEQIAEV